MQLKVCNYNSYCLWWCIAKFNYRSFIWFVSLWKYLSCHCNLLMPSDWNHFSTACNCITELRNCITELLISILFCNSSLILFTYFYDAQWLKTTTIWLSHPDMAPFVKRCIIQRERNLQLLMFWLMFYAIALEIPLAWVLLKEQTRFACMLTCRLPLYSKCVNRFSILNKS